MKKLILVRHAKSSWKHDVIDHQRPLKERGYTDANMVSKALIINDFTPDLVISSDAVRAKTTAEIFIKNLNINQNIVKFYNNLYDFSGGNVLKVIKSCDDNVNTLMVFGHNHALTDFVNTYGSTYIDNVPTSGLVAIAFNVNKWNDLESGETYKTIFPRDLKY